MYKECFLKTFLEQFFFSFFYNITKLRKYSVG